MIHSEWRLLLLMAQLLKHPQSDSDVKSTVAITTSVNAVCLVYKKN